MPHACIAISSCIVTVFNSTLLHTFNFVGSCIYIYIYDLIDIYIYIYIYIKLTETIRGHA